MCENGCFEQKMCDVSETGCDKEKVTACRLYFDEL